MDKKKIYVILMNTGTLLSKTIRVITRYKYSYVVLSLNAAYTKLYSFGRKRFYNFLNAGFVTYGIKSEFFQKFKNTDCVIYEIKVTNKQYYKLKKVLRNFEKNMNLYHYDIRGLLIRYFYPKAKARKNYYVCSQFVATVLATAQICPFEKPLKLIKPRDFDKIPNIEKIYEGKLLNLR